MIFCNIVLFYRVLMYKKISVVEYQWFDLNDFFIENVNIL